MLTNLFYSDPIIGNSIQFGPIRVLIQSIFGQIWPFWSTSDNFQPFGTSLPHGDCRGKPLLITRAGMQRVGGRGRTIVNPSATLHGKDNDDGRNRGIIPTVLDPTISGHFLVLLNIGQFLDDLCIGTIWCAKFGVCNIFHGLFIPPVQNWAIKKRFVTLDHFINMDQFP